MHALLTGAYLLLFTAILLRAPGLRHSGIPRRWLAGVFLLKFAVGLGLWAIYTYHYQYRGTSDAFRYYDNAMVLLELWGEDPALFLRMLTGIGMDTPEVQAALEGFNGWTKSYNYGIPNDNPTIIRINALIGIFSQGHYHVHTVFMCLLSTLGLVRLYRGLRAWIPHRDRVLFLAVFCAPSVLFWGSGVLKEAPLLLFLGLGLGGVLVGSKHGWTWGRRFGVLVGIVGLIVLKMYVLIALVPGLLSWAVLLRWKGKGAGWKVLGVHVLSAVLALNASVIYPPGDALYILSKKQTDFYNVAELMDAGSTIAIPAIEGIASVFKAFPGALYNAYLRPDLTEVESAFYLGLSLENAAIVLALLLAIGMGGLKFRKANVGWLLFSFVLLYGWMVGLTVPILGAIVRYKVPALPVLLALCSMGTAGGRLEGLLARRIPFKA